MQTLQPTLRLGRDVWDQAAMPVDEFRGRADRLRGAMAERGIDALLLYGSNLNGCGHPTYVANYIVKLPFAALVVLPREGDAALIFQGATRGRSAAQATTWIEDVRPCWNMAETCLAALAERGLTRARIGLAAMPRLVPHGEWARLVAGLADSTLVDAEDFVDHQRAIKSGREIAQIRRASNIVRRGLESLAQRAPSAGEWRVVADLIREARMQAAEDVRVMIARTNGAEWAFRPVDNVEFGEGDTVGVLLAASWERYWSESIRTFRVAADRFEPLWSADFAARFDTLAGELRAGVTTGHWSRTALASMTVAERNAIAPYGPGNGIGITPEEWPPLSDQDETRIEGRMCFAVRAAFESRDGMVLHGDTVVVP
jgi:Xaa-Pro aminopeptidase